MLYYKTFTNNLSNDWIVLIHGAGGSCEVWHRQVSDFARRYNLLLVDLVGHGGSANIPFGNNFSFVKAADQVMEVVNHLKIKSFHIMGISLGTIIVRIIGDRYAEQVKSMVLAGAVTELSLRMRLVLKMANLTKHILPYETTKRMMVNLIVPKKKHEYSRNLYFHNSKKVPFDCFLKWLKLGDKFNSKIRELFHEKIAKPTLYLMGEDDYLFLAKAQEALSSNGDMASLTIVPDAGHVCNVDNKKFFNEHTLAFIANY